MNQTTLKIGNVTYQVNRTLIYNDTLKIYQTEEAFFPETEEDSCRAELNKTFYSPLYEAIKPIHNYYIVNNKDKILKQWLITKQKWAVNKSYTDPLLRLARDDFGINDADGNQNDDAICTFKIYLNMYRHH